MCSSRTLSPGQNDLPIGLLLLTTAMVIPANLHKVSFLLWCANIKVIIRVRCNTGGPLGLRPHHSSKSNGNPKCSRTGPLRWLISTFDAVDPRHVFSRCFHGQGPQGILVGFFLRELGHSKGPKGVLSKWSKSRVREARNTDQTR